MFYMPKKLIHPAYSLIDFCRRKMALSWSKTLSTFLRGMTSKNNSDFYCLNCLHSFRTTNILELHKKVQDNRDFCNVVMLSEDTTVNQYRKT